MNKQVGAIFLLAGTAIGSGMVSLPLVLAKIGVIPSIGVLCIFFWLTYVTTMMRTEFNIKTKPELPLHEVCLCLEQKTLSQISVVSLRALHFALLAAYIYGLSSIINSITAIPQSAIIVALGVFLLGIFIFAANHSIIVANKAIFIVLLMVFATLICGLISNVDLAHLPSMNLSTENTASYVDIMPIVFTSFGVHGSLHSLTRFADNDPKIIKKACIFGSLIPCLVYIVWTVCALGAINETYPDFLQKMVTTSIDVGEFVKVLSNISSFKCVQGLVLSISILAIVTSVIGVGLALIDDLTAVKYKNNVATLITVIPTTLTALFVPDAFITILSFAGIILAVIAIFIPVILAQKVSAGQSQARNAAVIGFGTAIVLTAIRTLVQH